MKALIRRLSPRRLRDDRGAVAVMAAIMLVPIVIASAAVGIDSSNWYYLGIRLQTAADAAALAGAVYMPGDATTAQTEARKVTKANGFTHNPSDVDPAKRVNVVTSQGSKASQLRVTITATTSNFFGWSMDNNTQTITRTAVAEYRGPVLMGSPCNIYGNQPLGGYAGGTDDQFRTSVSPGANCPTTPQFWANIAGPGASKENGDRYASRTCNTGNSGCTSTTNNEYSPTGHFFKLTVKAPVTSLSVQVFDPAMVHVGNQCTTNLPSTWTQNLPNNYSNVSGDAAGRYVSGDSNQYCTGDQMWSGQATSAVTTFAVRSPIASGNPIQAPVVTACTKQYRGYGNTISFSQVLNKNSGSYNDTLASQFRQWVTLCTITNPEVGDYYVQVRSNLPYGTSSSSALSSSTEYPTVNWNGHNRYAMRVRVTGTTSNVTMAGYGQMAIYANSPAADTNFHLARVNAASAGMSLDVNLFDAGDASEAGTITIQPPSDATVNGAAMTLSTCSAMGAVIGSATTGTSLTNCQMTNVQSSTGFQGKSQVIRVAIPVGYTCNESDPYGCWFKIRFQYPSGTHDATTWATDLVGQPVRLVE